jgi:hypothetical protein
MDWAALACLNSITDMYVGARMIGHSALKE